MEQLTQWELATIQIAVRHYAKSTNCDFQFKLALRDLERKIVDTESATIVRFPDQSEDSE